MQMDPVITLAEELRRADIALREACERRRNESINSLLSKIVKLHDELQTTEPTSALGASELVTAAANRLDTMAAPYILHMHEVAERLSAGQRRLDDLIWLRAISGAMQGGLCGTSGQKAAAILDLAIKGMARPIMMFRAADIPDRTGMEPCPHCSGAI